MKFIKILPIFISIFFYCPTGYTATYYNKKPAGHPNIYNTKYQNIKTANTTKDIEYYDEKIVTISPQIALPIGIKIWFNESGGKVEGLTAWNKGENFASLGIGHFIWRPKTSKKATISDGFPSLINYMKERRDVKIPTWLMGQNSLNCPWPTRTSFLKAKNSPKMKELRKFLQNTITVQAEYMSRKLQEILPDLLTSTPMSDRKFIHDKFYELAKTPAGIYAMVDYMNFKGAGITKDPKNYKHGTGLLHVLKGMKDAPRGSTTLQAYTWSAKNALVKRVDRSDASKQHARWLTGWFKRVDTYLEGDPEITYAYAKPTPSVSSVRVNSNTTNPQNNNTYINHVKAVPATSVKAKVNSNTTKPQSNNIKVISTSPPKIVNSNATNSQNTKSVMGSNISQIPVNQPSGRSI